MDNGHPVLQIPVFATRITPAPVLDTLYSVHTLYVIVLAALYTFQTLVLDTLYTPQVPVLGHPVQYTSHTLVLDTLFFHPRFLY